jgi:hypothetical protein
VVRGSHEHAYEVQWGSSYGILKKIRKRAKFEVFIFYHKSRRKGRNKKLLAAIRYVKSEILLQNIYPESYFYICERKSTESIDFRCWWCLEPGKKIYLEQQFYCKYKFSNLDDDESLQKCLNEQDSLVYNFNQTLINRKISYYQEMKKFGSSLNVVNEKILLLVRNFDEFKSDINDLEKKINLQKKCLLEISQPTNPDDDVSFNIKDDLKRLAKEIQEATSVTSEAVFQKINIETPCGEDIEQSHFFRRLDNSKILNPQKPLSILIVLPQNIII